MKKLFGMGKYFLEGMSCGHFVEGSVGKFKGCINCNSISLIMGQKAHWPFML